MEHINLSNIKNIIFDLGVVLLDIDFENARSEFQELGLHDFDAFYSKAYADSFFHDFETGKITENEFISGIKKIIKNPVDDRQIVKAWNSIITGFPIEKVKFIEYISKRYNIYMLSNTNSLHSKKYEADFLEKAGVSIHSLFKKIYYSQEIGTRKPEIKAYTLILEEYKLKPEETLFIDDLEQNLEPARQLSMNTFHYKKKMDLFKIFHAETF